MQLLYSFWNLLFLLASKSLLFLDTMASEKTNLLEMIWRIITRSKDLVSDIIHRDYTWLDYRLFNTVSVADVIIIIVALLAVRDIIYFCFRLSANFFKNIVRTTMSYLSIQLLVSTRHIALRCYATLLFCWELEAVYTLREQIIQKINQFLNRD